MPQPKPPSLERAIEAIRDAAERGNIEIARNAQKGLERFDYDAEDAFEILADCCVDECTKHERHRYDPARWVYVFIIQLPDEIPIYAKVGLDAVTLLQAELMSFKSDGSPE